MAYNSGLLSMNYGLLWGIVAYFVGLLGVPGKSKYCLTKLHQHSGPAFLVWLSHEMSQIFLNMTCIIFQTLCANEVWGYF